MNVLITGGCEFIGTNLALRMLVDGHYVTAFDSLARPGSECNLATMQSAARKSSSFCFVHGDISERVGLDAAVEHADVVLHLAAQVSVIDGVNDPRTDFRSNVIGTFNVLEAARRSHRNPVVLGEASRFAMRPHALATSASSLPIRVVPKLSCGGVLA